jgi:siroheme synthase-like protein
MGPRPPGAYDISRGTMKTYPIMLDLRGRPAVVVGAGAVGVRKAHALLLAGAKVRIIDPQINEADDLSGMEVLRRPYASDLLGEARFVFACTDDAALNTRIARDARAGGALVNVADTPAECDFYLPAAIWDGDVVVAIGSGGSAPAMSAWLKRRIAAGLPQRLGDFAAAIEQLRSELRADVRDGPRRMDIMKRLVCDRAYEEFLRGGVEALRAELRRLRKDPTEG